jgi:hypothetical protein
MKKSNKKVYKENEQATFKNVEVDNSYLYHKFRSSIASQDFKNSETWPTAELSNDDDRLIAIAQLKPSIDENNEQEIIEWKDKMVQSVMKMDDLTADVLDIISYLWLERSKDPDSLIYVTADDFLRCRGIKEKIGGSGRRGGYEETQRKEIAENIDILDKTWITVREMELDKDFSSTSKKKNKKVVWRGESKAVVITSRLGQMSLDGKMEPYAWKVRPGDCFAKFLFGPGRQTALLSQRALEYDPQKYKFEKRLARYFAWQWRNRQSNTSFMQPFTVLSLLEACKENIDYSRPARVRERIEKALEKLNNDNVILGWQYESIDEDCLTKRGWVNEWINLKILVEPPQIVMDQYQKINNSKKFEVKKKIEERLNSFQYKEIKEKRINQNLTLLQASEEIGISVSRLSRIERGEKPSIETLNKILSWLEE